jgi:hypothetical protein
MSSRRQFKTSAKERARKRRWILDNRSRLSLLNRRYYRTHQAEERARSHAYATANRDRAIAATRAFRESNPNYQREWRARRRLLDAWRKWSITCAANRRALTTGEI